MGARYQRPTEEWDFPVPHHGNRPDLKGVQGKGLFLLCLYCSILPRRHQQTIQNNKKANRESYWRGDSTGFF